MFGRKKSKSIDVDEVIFEGTVLSEQSGGNSILTQYESRLGISSILPIIAILVMAVSFSFRIYFLQQDSNTTLSGQADSNLYHVEELVADRGQIFDRYNRPLVWNTKSENEEFSTRNYINQPGFTHVLGFISPPLKDNQGNFSRSQYEARAGVEKVYDDLLQGQNGEVKNETTAGLDDASGTRIKTAAAGSDLVLSIDSEIQAELYKSIESLVTQVNFKRGSGAIMDITTGEIIALTNYPEYDRDFNNQSAVDAAYINLFTSGLFTPGSIVKPFVALAALNEGVVTPEKEILSTKTITIPNPYNPSQPTYFSDWKAHGYVNVREAIAHSSNAYFYAVGGGLYDQPGVGITMIDKYMKAFGLGEDAGVAGFETVSGVVPSVEWKAKNYPDDKTWRLGDTFNTSIGQYGWQVTPLQMLRGVAAIANRGTLVQPTMRLHGEQKNTPIDIDISNDAYQIVHEGMRLSATIGTARGLNVPYVNVAAKTGTAELGVSKANVNSWVMGFWPYEEPKYAFVVLMNEGSRYNLTGATYVMRQLFDTLHLRDSKYLRE